MADFEFFALDTAGRERRGAIGGESIEEARARLDRRRLHVITITPAAPGAAQAVPLFALRPSQRLSAKPLTLFTRQLATLALVSPLEEALRTIAQQTEQDGARGVIERVHAGVVEGRRMSEAMAREPRSFPPLYRAMVAAGESAGTLPRIMERLAALLERQAALRAKMITALAYPVILALVAIFVVMALMVFVVPKVVDQFDTVGQTLPLLTRVVIALSHLISHYWWALLIAFAVASAAAIAALRDPGIRLSCDRAVLRLPLIGRLIRDLHAARMARTLSTMVAARLPLLEGLMLTAPTIRNRALRAASAEIIEAIRGGGSLSAALRRTGLFPPLLVYLAASGESAGQLDVMLAKAADYLEREFDGFTATALSLLEPAIIVVMGGIVATIVLSILLPILQLETLAAQ